VLFPTWCPKGGQGMLYWTDDRPRSCSTWTHRPAASEGLFHFARRSTLSSPSTPPSGQSTLDAVSTLSSTTIYLSTTILDSIFVCYLLGCRISELRTTFRPVLTKTIGVLSVFLAN
jgi:hypothetical protein